jgi:hypothetical protein
VNNKFTVVQPQTVALPNGIHKLHTLSFCWLTKFLQHVLLRLPVEASTVREIFRESAKYAARIGAQFDLGPQLVPSIPLKADGLRIKRSTAMHKGTSDRCDTDAKDYCDVTGAHESVF